MFISYIFTNATSNSPLACPYVHHRRATHTRSGPLCGYPLNRTPLQNFRCLHTRFTRSLHCHCRAVGRQIWLEAVRLTTMKLEVSPITYMPCTVPRVYDSRLTFCQHCRCISSIRYPPSTHFQHVFRCDVIFFFFPSYGHFRDYPMLDLTC